MIRKVEQADIPECVRVIRESFRTVADEFGFTEENAPRFTAFATTEGWLLWQMEGEHRLMFADEENGVIRGYYSLKFPAPGECELSNLAVLPEYRHGGIGGRLLKHAIDTAREQHCEVMNLGIVEENTVLRQWYERNGAVHTGTEKFDFFPFTCGYMKISL
ncbi:MAG: GNAT family N-acetyltransferase [Clostridia bacterium]|nr:GNAT family N-acetyltransferase [Clostridia bacterium]